MYLGEKKHTRVDRLQYKIPLFHRTWACAWGCSKQMADVLHLTTWRTGLLY